MPNHVGVATPMDSVWWRDLLTHGRASRYAEAFDVDWEFGDGKVRIPVLGDEPEPELHVVDGELRYHDHRFPLAPGSADDDAAPPTCTPRQHYELINWRRADAELNYRRFFAVNTLAGIRVEVPVGVRRVARRDRALGPRRLVDGLRVDHPDGLADPGGYLDALAAATGGTYVLVEKILEGDEQLPAVLGRSRHHRLRRARRHRPGARRSARPVRRSTRSTRRLHDGAGLGVVGGADPRHQARDRRRHPALGGAPPRTRPRPRRCRVDRRRQPIEQLADAIAELLACFPVYRSYLPLGLEHLHEAARSAAASAGRTWRRRSTRVVEVLADPTHPAAIRFQQTSGMVMAKGVEDTAFYRYTRLGSLTEVGGDPAEFSIDVDEFHRRQQLRQASLPRR